MLGMGKIETMPDKCYYFCLAGDKQSPNYLTNERRSTICVCIFDLDLFSVESRGSGSGFWCIGASTAGGTR